MASDINKQVSVEVTLAAAVVTTGTFEIPYPTGTTQASFGSGMATAANFIIVNDNDKWTQAAGKVSFAFGASVITVTNSTVTTLPAGAKVRAVFDLVDGNRRVPFVIPLPPLATITAADVITEVHPGIDGYLDYVEFVTTIAVTTAAKLASLNFEIGTTDVTGGVIALTSAAATPKGKVVAGSAITANNRLTKDSTLSLEASAVTAFVEGEGYVIAYIRPDPSDAY